MFLRWDDVIDQAADIRDAARSGVHHVVTPEWTPAVSASCIMSSTYGEERRSPPATWVWRSIMPGVTIRPLASIVRDATKLSGTSSMATIWSPLIATSPLFSAAVSVLRSDPPFIRRSH